MSNRRNTYMEYLRSPEWKVISEACKARDGQSCIQCGAKRSDVILEAHHLEYPKNLYDTELKHLVSLCQPCHAKIHASEKRQRTKKNNKLKKFNKLTKDQRLIARLQGEIDMYKNQNGIHELLEENKALREQVQRLKIMLEEASQMNGMLDRI